MMHQHPFLLDPSLSTVSYHDQTETHKLNSFAPGNYQTSGYVSGTPSRASTTSPPGSASVEPTQNQYVLPNATNNSTPYYSPSYTSHSLMSETREGEQQNTQYLTVP